jgi:hypothetical protein
MNHLLPNLRWVCLPSDSLGEDWFEKTLKIDEVLPELGYDLAEESVFILYSQKPASIIEGRGQCLIARPVIGPKKELKKPFSLVDWKASPVWNEAIQGDSLSELLAAAEKVSAFKKVADDFILMVKRELGPNLKLTVRAVFHE